MSRQSRFDAQYWALGAGALGRPRGMVWVGRREEGSGWGTHVSLWRIHFDIWQNQYNIVKFKDKKKKKRMDWLDLLAVQGTLKSLLQHHSYSEQKYSSPTLWSMSPNLAVTIREKIDPIECPDNKPKPYF